MRVVKLTPDYTFKAFDCGNADLNDFLLNDAKLYLAKKLSVTYILEDENGIIGYFSLSNDKLTVNDVGKSIWRKIKRQFDHSKHRSDYPAVKIGRLAVNRLYDSTDVLQPFGVTLIYLHSLFFSFRPQLRLMWRNFVFGQADRRCRFQYADR